MPKICDHTSVGILVFNKLDELLLIERAKFPPGFALPAGHVDSDENFLIAANRELLEEVGIENADLRFLIEGKKENPCRREGGSWHYWKLFLANRKIDASEVKRSMDETKKVGWYNSVSVLGLSMLTEDYLRGKITNEDWQQSPGLEPVMHEWFSDTSLHNQLKLMGNTFFDLTGKLP